MYLTGGAGGVEFDVRLGQGGDHFRRNRPRSVPAWRSSGPGQPARDAGTSCRTPWVGVRPVNTTLRRPWRRPGVAPARHGGHGRNDNRGETPPGKFRTRHAHLTDPCARGTCRDRRPTTSRQWHHRIRWQRYGNLCVRSFRHGRQKKRYSSSRIGRRCLKSTSRVFRQKMRYTVLLPRLI